MTDRLVLITGAGPTGIAFARVWEGGRAAGFLMSGQGLHKFAEPAGLLSTGCA